MVGSTLPIQERAYSLLHVKSLDVEKRVISGIATTPEADRMGDVVVPEGITFKNPLPLLLFHDSRRPVGRVKFAKATADGVEFEATIAKVEEPASLKDEVDHAWALVKNKLITGVSIGFRPLNDAIEIMKTGGLRFLETEVLELSLVAIPANASATIHTVKSFDSPYLAASGETDSQNMAAAVAAPRAVKFTSPKATAMKTVPEQKASFEATRQAKSARMSEIMQTAADGNVTLDEKQSEEYDGLDADVKSIDAHLVRLDALEKSNIQRAVPVSGGNPEQAAASRGGNPVITMSEQLPKGIGFARAVKANLVARLDRRKPLEVAREMYPGDDRLHKHLTFEQNLPNIIAQLKAAVPAATTVNSLWAGALVDPTNLAGEFIEFLRPATIIGRLNLRNIPTNVRLIEQTQGGTGYWVGQGAPKPLTAFGFAPITLSPTKVAAIAVATEESLRYSSPSLDMLIRDSLRDALVERVDRDLLDPAEAGTANVQPASLTNGLTALTSAGTSADNARTDLANLVQGLRSANLRGPIAIVLPDSLLTGMMFMANSLGQPEFPGLDNDGGTYKGIRFISSEYVANASGGGNMIVAIAEREVFRSDDGGVRVDASDQASLQMLDNPTNNSATATATTMVSMWQTNSVAFRGEWFINWSKRRAGAVVYMDDVNWGSVGSP